MRAARPCVRGRAHTRAEAPCVCRTWATHAYRRVRSSARVIPITSNAPISQLSIWGRFLDFRRPPKPLGEAFPRESDSPRRWMVFATRGGFFGCGVCAMFFCILRRKVELLRAKWAFRASFSRTRACIRGYWGLFGFFGAESCFGFGARLVVVLGCLDWQKRQI